MLGSGLAEVTTPQGRTIRVSVPSGSNFKSGQTVQPTFNRCCLPTGLVLPTPSSGKEFKDVLQPRRITQISKTLSGDIWINNGISVNYNKEDIQVGLEIRADRDGNYTKGRLEDTAKRLASVPGGIFYTRMPSIRTMPTDSFYMVDYDTGTSLYDLVANTDKGLVGVYLKGNEYVQEVIRPTRHPNYPTLDPSADLASVIASQTVKVKDIYRVCLMLNTTQTSGYSYYSFFSIELTGESPLTLFRSARDEISQDFVNGIDSFHNNIKGQLYSINSNDTVYLHTLTFGGSLTGSRTTRVVSEMLQDHRGEADPVIIEDSISETYPNYSFSDSGLNRLISGLANPKLLDWVTFKITKDAVFWGDYEIKNPPFYIKNNPNSSTSGGDGWNGSSTFTDYSIYDSRVFTLSNKIYVV